MEGRHLPAVRDKCLGQFCIYTYIIYICINRETGTETESRERQRTETEKEIEKETEKKRETERMNRN